MYMGVHIEIFEVSSWKRRIYKYLLISICESASATLQEIWSEQIP